MSHVIDLNSNNVIFMYADDIVILGDTIQNNVVNITDWDSLSTIIKLNIH